MHTWKVTLTREVTVVANSRREAMQKAKRENGGKAVSVMDQGETRAIFLNECDACEFLGSTVVGVRAYDLYVHQADPVVLNARYGDGERECFARPLTNIIAALKQGSDYLENALLDAYNLYQAKLGPVGDAKEKGRT